MKRENPTSITTGPVLKTYRAFIEIRDQGAIGAFSIARYTVEAVSQAEAARLACEKARAEGYETRFPSHVDEAAPLEH
jgi:hypothetical protein